jgi:hypothetical protein
LRNQTLATDILTIEPVVDIAQRITRRSEGEADHGEDERVRALETIRPLALHAIPTAVRIWGRPNLAQLPNGVLILERPEPRSVRVGSLAALVRYLSSVVVRVRHTEESSARARRAGRPPSTCSSPHPQHKVAGYNPVAPMTETVLPTSS